MSALPKPLGPSLWGQVKGIVAGGNGALFSRGKWRKGLETVGPKQSNVTNERTQSTLAQHKNATISENAILDGNNWKDYLKLMAIVLLAQFLAVILLLLLKFQILTLSIS